MTCEIFKKESWLSRCCEKDLRIRDGEENGPLKFGVAHPNNYVCWIAEQIILRRISSLELWMKSHKHMETVEIFNDLFEDHYISFPHENPKNHT